MGRFESLSHTEKDQPETHNINSSRSNCANESRMFKVNLPIEVVVQNDCVTETKVTLFRSNTSTSLAKSVSERDSLSIL
jgi:hypothetical protein